MTEDVSHGTRLTISALANATSTVVEPSPEPESFDIEVPINNDPVQIPEKPVKRRLVIFPPIWAEVGILYCHPVSL